MTIRQVWILSAVMAALPCGLLAACLYLLNDVSCGMFGIGGVLILDLMDPIRRMLGLGQPGQTLDHVLFYAGNWIFFCVIFFLVFLGLRKTDGVVGSKLTRY